MVGVALNLPDLKALVGAAFCPLVDFLGVLDMVAKFVLLSKLQKAKTVATLTFLASHHSESRKLVLLVLAVEQAWSSCI